MPARRNNHQLNRPLTMPRAITTSTAGIRPPSCLTHTPMSENPRALASMDAAADMGWF